LSITLSLSLSLSQLPRYEKEDLIGEICAAVVEWEYRHQKPFPPSLVKTFISCRASDFLKKARKRRKRVVFFTERALEVCQDGKVDIEEEICEEETRREEEEKLKAALSQGGLTKGEKRALRAWIKEKRSIQKAARRLRVSVNTMRNWYRRFMKKICPAEK